jgi:hypothetical protein
MMSCTLLRYSSLPKSSIASSLTADALFWKSRYDSAHASGRTCRAIKSNFNSALARMACVCEQKEETAQQLAQVPTLQLVTIQMFFTNVHRCITKQKLANLMKRRRHKNNHV